MIEVESVIRGIEILRLLNVRTGLTLTELAEQSGLARGTAYRLLYTLEASGYVQRIEGRYWITHRVRTLSHGFDHDWACEHASPVVRELGRKLHWPVTLSEHSRGVALVRETTDSETTLKFSETKPGFRMSMVMTASGRILLAYAPPRKQRTLLDYLRVQPLEGHRPSQMFAGDFHEITNTIRERGYDVMTVPHGRQTAIAVPVLASDGTAAAALAVRYFNSAMTYAEAVDRFVAPLQHTAEQISRSLDQRAVN